jgi:phospholipase/lecithinase/hemolysin
MEEGGVEMKPVLLGAALLMLAIVSASAAPFSALYAFGDSLSDAGNTFIATGNAFRPLHPMPLSTATGCSAMGRSGCRICGGT